MSLLVLALVITAIVVAIVCAIGFVIEDFNRRVIAPVIANAQLTKRPRSMPCDRADEIGYCPGRVSSLAFGQTVQRAHQSDDRRFR